MTVTVEQILSTLHTLDPADVRRVNELAYGILKQKRRGEVAAAKRKLHTGMAVTWNGKYGPKSGTIVKVNRTRCVVNTGGYRNWTVPMTMLKAV
jgi:hypothetical protein